MWHSVATMWLLCSLPSTFQAVKSATEISPEIVSPRAFSLGMVLVSKLFRTRSQKDLGIVLCSCRNPSAQCTAVVQKKDKNTS